MVELEKEVEGQYSRRATTECPGRTRGQYPSAMTSAPGSSAPSALGWLWRHENGTYVKFTDSGAALFA
jgi:hypothetical protein